MKRLTYAFAALAAIPFAGLGCGNQQEEDTTSSESAALGGALPGVNSTTFAAAKANFQATEVVSDGLGPIFNERACGNCHSAGAQGGAGSNVERRYGTFTNGVFNSLASTGGSLRQLFGVGGYTDHDGTNCNSGTDSTSPAGATVFAGRVTTPTFGAGLVELIPDATIQNIANAQSSTIRGTVNHDTIHLTSGPFSRGQSRVAKFGWKAVHASAADFAADAYLNEMGITTISCAGTTRVTDFATENRANRTPTNAVINNCDDDGKPGTDDVAATTCSATEVQDDVANFAFFMRALAAPPRGVDNSSGRGLTEFNREGCNGCHVTTAFTVNINGQNISFQPFSDFLVHDMGTLGDQIGNDGDSPARTRQMRTAPLWGLHTRNGILHDARTTDRSAAIRAHDGQGAAARNAFNAASSTQRNDLLLFLSSL